jgi:uncharacterized membrane protein YkvA (DUF1232 family)
MQNWRKVMLVWQSITRQIQRSNDESRAPRENNQVRFDRLKAKAAALKREVFALYLAARDPRTPWYAKVFVVCIVAYALSPIDLIPDPIPIIGYLDDLLLLPLGIYLALKMIPPEVLTECRAKAAATRDKLPRNWWAGTVIVLLWLVTLMLAGFFVIQIFLGNEKSDARLGY